MHSRRPSRVAAERLLSFTCSAAAADAPPAGVRASPPAVLRVAVTLAVGAAGAAAFRAVGAPLPFMLGSLTGSGAAALAGLPVLLPSPLRYAWQTVIGTALGASFTLELLSRAAQLPLSIAGLFVATAGATGAAALVLRRGARYELPTSFFAAVPGGLNDMTLIGGEMGGDERTIALSHTVRLVAVVSLLPLLMRSTWAPAAAPAITAALPALSATLAPAITSLDAAVLLACASAGPAIGRMLRLPARFLVGPLLLSGLAHMAGVTQARPPAGLIAAAQVVVGAAVGCRFSGVQLGAMRSVIAWALATTSIQVSVCSACAAAMACWTATPFPLLLLAYSPGGITELTLCAVALGMDSAFVATHHIMRILAITLGTPTLFALAGRVRDRLRSRG